jgi:hypothetical protein
MTRLLALKMELRKSALCQDYLLKTLDQIETLPLAVLCRRWQAQPAKARK